MRVPVYTGVRDAYDALAHYIQRSGVWIREIRLEQTRLAGSFHPDRLGITVYDTEGSTEEDKLYVLSHEAGHMVSMFRDPRRFLSTVAAMQRMLWGTSSVHDDSLIIEEEERAWEIGCESLLMVGHIPSKRFYEIKYMSLSSYITRAAENDIVRKSRLQNLFERFPAA